MTELKKTKTDKVSESITLLAEAIKGLEVKIDVLLVPKVEAVTVPIDKELTNSSEPEMIMNPIFRQIVDERLNKNFPAKIKYRPDGFFEFSVHVPREYSNVTENKFKQDGADIRLKVIENALGEIGVREWVDKIAENLGHDIMQKVISDQVK